MVFCVSSLLLFLLSSIPSRGRATLVILFCRRTLSCFQTLALLQPLWTFLQGCVHKFSYILGENVGVELLGCLVSMRYDKKNMVNV